MLDYGNQRRFDWKWIWKKMCNQLETLLKNENLYQIKSQKASDWSRNYTLDVFENEIKKLLTIMRILQIIDSLEAGGAERMAVNYANALANEMEFSGLVVTRKEGPLLNQVN